MVKTIFPLVRLDESKTFDIANALNPQGIFIRFQDLISPVTLKPNGLFHKIVKAGGIHQYLDYNGIVVLSLIMRDTLIWGTHPEEYATIINGINPNAYTTVDGATYGDRESFSKKEIIRITKETIQLIPLCPNILPIGHVKGCNSYQIKVHLEILKRIGIKTFLLHLGDFSRNGNHNEISKGKAFAEIIKREGGRLFIYGLGSKNRFLEFSFADCYVTYGHMVSARMGKIHKGDDPGKYKHKSIKDIATENLRDLYVKLEDLKKQTKLFWGGKSKWAAEIVTAEQKVMSELRRVRINH